MRRTSVLGPGGESTGTVTYRKLADGFYEAVTEGKSEGGAFTIKRDDRLSPRAEGRVPSCHRQPRLLYTQMAEVGGNIGGDYRLFFKSAPFAFKGKQVRLNHTVYLAAPLTFRIDVEVADGGRVHAHEPVAISTSTVLRCVRCVLCLRCVRCSGADAGCRCRVPMPGAGPRSVFTT